MSKEMKETLFKDEDGDYKDWVPITFGLLIFVGVCLLITGFVVGITAVADYYEVRAFNKIHGTEYTFAEWFWAEYTIKDYHLGTVENKNYQVGLNINRLEETKE